MHPSLSRRQLLIGSGRLIAAGCAVIVANSTRTATAHAALPRRPLLGFSLYGMKKLPLAEALQHCATIGYRCVELPLLVDWPADTAKFPTAAKQEFRDGLKKHDLRLSALMENLPLLGDDAKHRANLQRLKAAAELAHELVPNDLPLIETVLGAKPAEWNAVKQQFVDRLGDWAQVMADAKVKLAIKAHISNAIQQPKQLQWVLEQVDSPWLTAAYDFSHFELQQLPLAETLEPLAGRITFVHVKDGRGAPGKFQFLLPGEGKTDYGLLFAALAKAKYAGDIVVEVSGQIHSQANYDGVAAAKKCYAALAPAMKQFGGEDR